MLLVLLICAFATALPNPENGGGYNYPKPAVPFEDAFTCPRGESLSPPNCTPPKKVVNEYLPPDNNSPPSSADNTCTCKKDAPLKAIFQNVPHFKQIQVCGRKCETNVDVSKDGVRKITYTCELKNEKESPIELCDCVYGYLSQKDWLEGAIRSCCVRKNIVTMTLEGEPDPTYNELADEPVEGDPKEQLQSIFEQFTRAEVEGHDCTPSTPTDEFGQVHFNIKCDLKPDSPPKEEICDGVLQYLNQDNWLGEVSSNCESDGKHLDVEVLFKGGQ